MKVSKVGNTKIAVGKSNNRSTGGFSYVHPGDGEKDLKKQLEKLNSQANKLYNLFVPIQVGQAPHRKGNNDENYLVKKANYDRRVKFVSILSRKNRTITAMFFKFVPNKMRPDKKFKILCSVNEVITNIQSAERLDLSDKEIEELVVLALRKSIKDIKLKEDKTFCATAAAGVFLKNFGNKKISDTDKHIISNFVKAVKQDYEKFDPRKDDSLGAKTVRSIQNQNMLFQPSQDTFALSSVTTEKKNTDYKANEKQGYEEFLSLYADLNNENRKDLLCKLNRLIDLYFAALKEDGGEPCGKVIFETYDAFEHHVVQKADEENFVEVPDALVKAVEQQKRMDSVKKKQEIEKLKEGIRVRNIACYRYAKEQMENDTHGLFFADNNINMFWIHHIENAIERILKKIDESNLYKLNQGYLKNKLWKDMLNTISIKYVAAGKAVYNFAMDDLFDGVKSELKLGELNETIKTTGINSFDYEMIKAQETLQREIAVNVQSAANNLARATVDIARANQDEKKDASDFLLWTKDDIGKYILSKNPEDTYRNIFQFFGGKSVWKDQIEVIESKYNKVPNKVPSEEFLNDLRKVIYALRNESFHFTTASVNQGDWDMCIIGDLFVAETKRSVSLERDAFYSNNLPMFYDSDDLKKVLDCLYEKTVERQSQIPSYGTVMVRSAFPEFLESNIGKNNMPFSEKGNEELKLKWENACYYLCKEIYYNAFLSDESSKELFLKAADHLTRGEHENAVKNFQSRIDELKTLSLTEICQTIMTDYNMQNNGRKVRSSKDSLFDKEIYKHYKLLLHMTLKDAFAEYIDSQDVFRFIKTPKKGQAVCLPPKELFLPKWSSQKYDNFAEQVKKDAQLQKWYITGKFLSPRNLNLLVGSMRSYIQYADDVRKRANATNNEIHLNEQAAKDKIKEAIKVLEVCLKTASGMSSEFTDYFEDENNYALFLSNYVNYGKKLSFEGLKDFCNGLIKNQDSQNALYTDAKKPKLNRNMVIAKLYGPTQILAELVSKDDKIDESKINEFYEAEKNIQSYKANGKCKDKKEQEQLSNYQKLKNQVELRNVAEYGELINELLGQLVNWSFVRERDLLYFQLGFHYYCLQNNSEKPDAYKTIVSQDGKTIKGAILYQIAGMYINGTGIWIDEDGQGFVEKAKIGSVGGKIKKFDTYTKNLEMNEDELYYAGMEVFENIHEHDSIVGVRNYIDHFKYYNIKKDNGHSILDLYSEVLDRFFTYDMKYQKNVANMLVNILARHFYLIEPRFNSGEKKMDKGTKDKGQIEVREIESEKFTFKLSDNTKAIEMPARRKEELETVLKILYYPKEVPNGINKKVLEPKEVSVKNNKKNENKVKSGNHRH